MNISTQTIITLSKADIDELIRRKCSELGHEINVNDISYNISTCTLTGYATTDNTFYPTLKGCEIIVRPNRTNNTDEASESNNFIKTVLNTTGYNNTAPIPDMNLSGSHM